MDPNPTHAELLRYLAELGWEEVRRPAGTSQGAAVPTRTDVPPSVTTSPDESSPDALAELARTAAGCRACGLCAGRQSVVFGDGDPHARLMFIGEAPGAEEDRQGKPFVGAAGALLTRMISAMGLSREETYITNVVKCRPPGNRDPRPEEAAACRGFLEAQIDLVRPRVLVALGRVAAQALLGNETPIGRLRGRWYEVRNVPTMVTYHPAALLRNGDYRRPTWEDLQQVRDRLLQDGRS